MSRLGAAARILKLEPLDDAGVFEEFCAEVCAWPRREEAGVTDAAGIDAAGVETASRTASSLSHAVASRLDAL